MIVVLLFFTCQKEAVNVGTLSPSLIGKWEAAYEVSTNADTTFYDQNSVFACAYAVLPFDYNSGFELTDEENGDLIWCGSHKEQFFRWEGNESELTFIWLETQEYHYTFIWQEEDKLLLVYRGTQYLMQRF
ncbi:MAG: hypothetical protein AAFU03_15870 [Bacteroidota bacterium]